MVSITTGISIKSNEDLKKMTEGGRLLHSIKEELKKIIKVGTNAAEVEKLATDLLVKTGGQPSFKMVPDYYWSTCINVNSGLVHGIPRKNLIFKKGDLVSVDIGLYYQGFHSDSSFSLGLELTPENERFLKTGEIAQKKAIQAISVGGYIYDISQAMEKTIKGAGYSPIKALVGHGVGRELHEEPAIPCFTEGKREDSPQIKEGMVLAIEVMYAMGKADVALEKDGWTIGSADGKITALFEETVAVTKSGPIVLT
jgi:methionyl aminopeptidase